MLDFNQQDIYLDQTIKQINVPGHKIDNKEFDNCVFEGCNFSDAQFMNCKFYECKFIQCNLSMITVKECSFFDVVFEETKALGINWTQAAWPRIKLNSPLKFYRCILNNSSFFGLCITEIAMVECKAKEIDLRGADCREADFSYTDFAHGLFGNTNLAEANFSEAINYNIDLFHNNIKKAKFSLPEAMSLLNGLDIELVD